jgi:hypothetical protein
MQLEDTSKLYILVSCNQQQQQQQQQQQNNNMADAQSMWQRQH